MNDYDKIADIIEYLAKNVGEQPDLATLANMAELSPGHFQRKFTQWVGVSPKSYLQCLTFKDAKSSLDQGDSLFESAFNAGLSGSGRLHDLCVTLDAATPGEIKRGGEGLQISYGFGLTPFGECIIANSQRGICYLAFISQDDHKQAVTGLRKAWPAADLLHSNNDALHLIKQVFNLQTNCQQSSLRAYVRGTNFQLQVWRALLRIPEGRLVTYGTLASVLDKPGAARAVGSAVGANLLAYLIPCHRVIRNTGIIGEYRWGSQRKKALIACERAKLTGD